MVLEENDRVDDITKSHPGGVPSEASMNTPSRSEAVGTSRTRLGCYFKQPALFSKL